MHVSTIQPGIYKAYTIFFAEKFICMMTCQNVYKFMSGIETTFLCKLQIKWQLKLVNSVRLVISLNIKI